MRYGLIKSNIKQTITRDHLSGVLRREGIRLNMPQANVVIDCIIKAISESLINSNSVKIRSFGTFTCRFKGERLGRNPKTMTTTIIPERFTVNFKVSPTLKKRINAQMIHKKQIDDTNLINGICIYSVCLKS